MLCLAKSHYSQYSDRGRSYVLMVVGVSCCWTNHSYCECHQNRRPHSRCSWAVSNTSLMDANWTNNRIACDIYSFRNDVVSIDLATHHWIYSVLTVNVWNRLNIDMQLNCYHRYRHHQLQHHRGYYGLISLCMDEKYGVNVRWMPKNDNHHYCTRLLEEISLYNHQCGTNNMWEP